MINYKYIVFFYVAVLKYIVSEVVFMRHVMNFIKELSKLMLIGAVITFSDVDCSEFISYHLFRNSSHHPKIDINPVIKDMYSKELICCNEKFQSANCTDLEDMAETLIPQYKTIFLGKSDDEALNKINSLEEEWYAKKIDFLDATKQILEQRQGLPEASYQLACMYNQEGIYRVALLWSEVAYELGIHSGELLGNQLIFKLSTLQ